MNSDSRSARRSAAPVASLLVLALAGLAAISACQGNGSNSPVSARARAGLSGRQEVPPVATAAAGSARLDVNLDETRIDVSLEAQGLTDVASAHVHVGALGVNGPVIFTLYTAADGPFMSPLDVPLLEEDLEPAPEAGIVTFDDAIAALKRGDLYVNVHTTANPGGEIRGQAGAATLSVSLSGAQESASVATAARGDATVALDDEQEEIRVDLATSGLDDRVTAAHIHVGAPGVDGPVIFDLLGSRDFGGSLSTTLDESDFEASPSTGTNTFEDAIQAILSGGAYVNVHSNEHPAGEIRGQIGRVVLSTFLNGAQEVPPVTTIAVGSSTIGVDGAHSRIDVAVDTFGLVDVVAAHIHAGEPGMNGPVIFGLYSTAEGPFTGSIAKTLFPADFEPAPELGLNDFASAVDALLAGRTYVNVHTVANVGGEIRGHAGPIALGTSLSGSQETPPIATTAKGRGTVALDATHGSIRVTLETTGLPLDQVTVAHVHAGVPGTPGPPIFDLFDATIDGPFTGSLDVTVGPDELEPSLGDGILTFPDAVAAILSGRTYVNVHTETYPPGEIRGHVGPLALEAVLGGQQETPPVPTTASGTGSLFLSARQNALVSIVETAGLVDVTMAHIHVGAPGDPGPVVFGLYEAADGPFPAGLEDALDAAALTPAPKAGVETFADAVAAIVSGNTYFNVHTAAHPSGEIRGQIRVPGP